MIDLIIKLLKKAMFCLILSNITASVEKNLVFLNNYQETNKNITRIIIDFDSFLQFVMLRFSKTVLKFFLLACKTKHSNKICFGYETNT